MAQDWFDSATSGASQPAPRSGGAVVIRNPWKAKEEARKDEDQAFERERIRIAQEANDRAAAATNAQIANMNKPPVGYRWGPPDAQGNPTMEIIPGGPADKSTQSAMTSAQRLELEGKRGTLRNLAVGISQLRQQYEDNFKGKSAGEYLPAFANPKNGVFNDTSGSLSAYVAAALGLSGQQFNTPAEQQLFIGSILPRAGDTDAQIENKLNRLDDLIRNADETSAGQLGIKPAGYGAPAQGGNPPSVGGQQGGGSGGSPGPYQNDPSGNRTFLTERDKAFAEEASALFKKPGVTRADFDALAQKYNAQPFGPDLDKALQNPAAATAFAPQPTGFEEAGLTGAIMGPWANSGFGSYAIGTGNALTAGQLGNIAELTGSSEGGTAVAMDMAQENAVPYFLGELGGGALATAGLGGGLGYASRFAANPTVASLLANPMSADAAYGALYGGASADDPLYGAIGGAATALGGSWLGSKVGGMIGGSRIDDPLNRGERAVINAMDRGTGISVEEALQQGQDLGLPMTLADVSPEVAALAGAAIRRSPTVAGQARDMLQRRGLGQIDRFRDAVARDLGPVTNIPQRSEDLIAQARAEAGPLYDAAYAAPGVEELDIANLLARPSVKDALPAARRMMLEEDLNPYVMGFVENDAGDITIPGFDRFVEARGPKPANPMSVITGQGNSAPSDLLTFIRRNGGLIDQGGELKFMGMTNAGRKGVPMAGQDAKFGPLVSENGRTLDDMAQAAWEAGYFGPVSTTPRPTTREFLDALEDTYRGGDRRFSINDEDTVNQYFDYQRMADEWNAAEGIMADRSVPAGPDVPFAPPTAFGSMEEIAPTWQALDYVTRGLSDVVESNINPATMKLNNQGRLAAGTRDQLLMAMDAANPDYAAARAAYAGPMQERQALESGMEAIRANPDQLAVDVANIPGPRMDQWRLGMQSGLVNQAEVLSNSTNPFRILNTPAMERRLSTLYPEQGDDVARLLLQRDLENKMAGTSNFLAGNSATAERAIADQAFADEGLLRPLVEGAAETAAYGAPVMTIGRQAAGRFLSDRAKLGFGQRAMKRAEEIAPIALNPDPADTIAQILALQERQAGYQSAVAAAKEAAARRAGRAGGVTTSATIPFWMGD